MRSSGLVLSLAFPVALAAAASACGGDGTAGASAAPDAGDDVPTIDGGAPDHDVTTKPAGPRVSFLTLNLHGYHAMDEAPRFFEDESSGALTPAISSPFYFTLDELFRGNTKRLDALAADLRARLPDVIALQEVAAGAPDTSRDCAAFTADTPGDEPHTNTALRLARRLAKEGYQAVLGCRGNVGWTTDPGTFASRRIVRKKGDVVFDFGESPYPDGILVEGFALLVRSPIEVLTHEVLDVPHGPKGERIKAQIAALRLPRANASDEESPVIAVVNVHGGHKLAHFEQAVALRAAVSAWMTSEKVATGRVVFLGDFNARLHRPNEKGVLEEAASAPWEIKVEGQFDYVDPEDGAASQKLADALLALNASSYKSFATLPEPEAKTRIDAAIAQLRSWQRSEKTTPVLHEALFTSSGRGACKPPTDGHGACSVDARIDHVFFGGSFEVAESYALYTHHDDHRLAGTFTDHPGIAAVLALPPAPR